MDYDKLNIPRCKKFSGYKPCISFTNCLENGCQQDTLGNRMGTIILIVSLEAMGSVLTNTAILHAIKRKYTVSTIYWITMPNAEKILMNNLYIDRTFTWTDENRMILRKIQFDVLMNADKTDYACAFASEVQSALKLGFLLNRDGKIVPANSGALYNYRMGSDDRLKFRTNVRTGVDIIHETFELEFRRDEYTFELAADERHFIEEYKRRIGYDPSKTYIGFNTGCSSLFPNKKMTIEQHVTLINDFVRDENLRVVLLGGREDTERNEEILQSFNSDIQRRIIPTSTTQGLRRGACYMDICDVVVTGDSFGMHLAIALKKHVIAWFGLSCWTEIEFYGRGEKIVPEGLECAPCWKKVCPYNLECIQMIDLKKIVRLVKEFSLRRRRHESSVTT